MTDCIISDKDKKYTKRMLDYNLFHKHPVNKLIHTIAIPQIIWTSCVLLSFIPLPIVTNMSYLVYGLMVTYYFDIKREYGIDMSIFMGSLLLFSKIFMLVFTNYLAITLFVFTMSWIAQFAGHYVWEKNSPALLTSIFDAFTMAPLFCYIEIEKNYNTVKNIKKLGYASFNHVCNYVEKASINYQKEVNIESCFDKTAKEESSEHNTSDLNNSDSTISDISEGEVSDDNEREVSENSDIETSPDESKNK